MTRLRRDSGKATCRKRPESDGKTDSVGSKTSGDRPNVVEHGGSPSEYRRVFEDASKQQDIQKSQYWLTRIVLLRSLGLVYAIAFLVALNQNKYLIGRKGLLPAHLFLREVKRYAGGVNAQAVFQVPTLLWFLEHMGTDSFLDGVASLGFLLALGVTVTGAANALAMFLLWALYHSIVNIGQQWYSFGWESQLLETGFLAIFFCPLVAWKQLPRCTPPPRVVVWAYRWLLFRIMLGAGLIKIRGDKCWMQLTCMNYHYETQPVPSPVSYCLHQSPAAIHAMEVLGNHFIELIVPWFLFFTRPFRLACGTVQFLFQREPKLSQLAHHPALYFLLRRRCLEAAVQRENLSSGFSTGQRQLFGKAEVKQGKGHYQSGTWTVPGFLECASCGESCLASPADEHFVRTPSLGQHVWSIWKHHKEKDRSDIARNVQ